MNYSEIFSIQSYALNPYAISPFLVASLMLIFSFFLYFLEKRSPFNRSMLYFCLSSALWLYSCVLILSSKQVGTVVFWSNFLYASFILVPATLFHFSVSLPNKYQQEKSLILSVYVLATILIFLNMNISDPSAIAKHSFGYYPKANDMQLINLAFFALCFIGILINLIVDHCRRQEPTERSRTKLFIICFVVGAFSVIDILATYNFYLYPSGFIAFFGFIIGITCFKLMFYYATIDEYTHNLEDRVRDKTKELSQVVDELRTTQFKLLEAGKVSALASLSAGILHQISQPITAIHGFIRFMSKEMKKDDVFYKPVLHIEEQSVYLKDMLEDLMNLVRHREIVKNNVNVNDSIKRSINLLQDELRIRRVNWDANLPENLPQVYADSVHLQQIFMNIIVNSAQAMSLLPKGKERHLKITSSFDKGEKKIVISFQDTGVGLSEQEREAIFEPFFSTKAKGAGIGLSLGKDLIQEHSGTIGVESEKGKGTKLIIKFPPSEDLTKPDLNVKKE